MLRPGFIGAALAVLGAVPAAAQTPLVEDKPAFTQRCVTTTKARYPNSEGWAADACRVKWDWAEAAAPMAEAIVALARTAGGTPPPVPAMQGALGGVVWSADGSGRLGDLWVTLPADGAASFHWEELGSEGRFNLIDALRIRGVELSALGCPVYPGASMGQEKVMLARVAGADPFAVTVYSRPAPAGFSPGVYSVDVQVGAPAPDRAALEAGAYPGGGGRAFAVDVQGWVDDCFDPE